jgi:tetratricopeptide (TPR) repeat protein
VLLLVASRQFLEDGDAQKALDAGKEGLAMAQELGVVSLEVHALTLIGGALHVLGQGGVPELERAVALGSGGAAPKETQSARNSLASLMFAHGRIRAADEIHGEAFEDNQRFGLSARLPWPTAMRGLAAFELGEWRRAEGLIDRYHELAAATGIHGADFAISILRTNLTRACGEPAAALALADETLAVARSEQRYQYVGTALAVRGLALVENGRKEEAAPLVDELLGMTDESGNALWFRWLIDLAWLMHDLGRSEALPSTPYPVWSEPANAIARGDLAAAAELLAATELVSEEAYARLRAAEQLTAGGRYREAQDHAVKAAAFYRSVGAAAYVRRTEALLPAHAGEL